MNLHRDKRNRSGFIALISAIIVSALLLSITLSLSLAGYYSRFNTLYAEYKKKSVALAEACGDVALLNIAENTTMTTPLVVPVGSNNCTIYSASSSVPVAGETTVKIKATHQGVVTNLVIVASSTGATIILWEEIPNLP